MPQSSSQNDLTIRLAAESELDAVAPLLIEFAQLFAPTRRPSNRWSGCFGKSSQTAVSF